MQRMIFYSHWLAGLVAGTLLMVIGASGAALVFEEEILNLLNPGVRQVQSAGRQPLAPPAMLAAIQQQVVDKSVGALTVYADPQQSARVMLQGERGGRGELVYVDPYSGALLGQAKGQAFFDWTERLHRFLLLPRDAGRIVAGTLSLSLILLMLTGVYLRWPSRPTSLREWLALRPRLRGRPLWWNLHAVVATWAVPVWLVLAGTGIYWSFDNVRAWVDGMAGVQRQVRPRAPMQQKSAEIVDMQTAWEGFAAHVEPWASVRFSLPRNPREGVEFAWLPQDAPHERAGNRMRVGLDGKLMRDERFSEQSAGRRALAAIYPLHMGRYFGLAGQLAVLLAALALPFLGVTGWWLYLRRRRGKARAKREKAGLETALVEGDAPPVLVAYASQTGQAERLAMQTARRLQEAGCRIIVKSLAQLSPPELVGYPQALFVVSTYGDGQAPDAARGFARALAGAAHGLQPLNYAVLALGNRQYPNFCGFGRYLHDRLQQLGAAPHAPVHMVCESQTDGYRAWFANLQRFGVTGAGNEALSDAEEAGWMECALAERQLLNAGSCGAPLYEVQLTLPESGALPQWQPGALLEVQPRHSAGIVQTWLRQHGLTGVEAVEVNGKSRSLLDVLSERHLPAEGIEDVVRQLGQLPMLAPRRYSVASVMEDGCLQLIVRQYFQSGTLGLASGWLTEHCPVGGAIRARLLPNPSFGVTPEAVPCVFIGAGSGLAGLRGLLRERMRRHLGQNWLVLGERQAEFDTLCAEEFDAYCAAGLLQVDRVFSRDVMPPAYVQDCLREHASRLCQLVDAGGHIHVCGSAAGMGESVDDALREILGFTRVDELATAGRYRRDVY